MAAGKAKSMQQHCCEGLEAALKADPEAFARVVPKTQMGKLVKALVCEAGKGKCAQIRLLFQMLEAHAKQAGDTEAEAEQGKSPGHSRANPQKPPRWDWDENGWDLREIGESGRAAQEAKLKEQGATGARLEAARDDLRQKFLRTAEADRLNEARNATPAAAKAA